MPETLKALHQPSKKTECQPSKFRGQLFLYRTHDDQAAEYLAKKSGLFAAADRAFSSVLPVGSRVYTSQPEDIQTKKREALGLSHPPQVPHLAFLFLDFEQPCP
ncbi:hypothetical protein FHW68_000609 [Pseudomonas sp. Tn43]|uniref:hypothetical protein n=1 Tax=Pseudomonas sp. Tn43 TaxID=701213 RepID=UPI001622CF83|nr:hypothetical protein [Pseudomonas sp. Tn43]MBB3239137.1 hypothetical protein [Pseudomonas sp. Tn43]